MSPLLEGSGNVNPKFDVTNKGKRLQPLYFTKKYSLLKETFPDDCALKPDGTSVRAGGIDAAAGICYFRIQNSITFYIEEK